MKRAIDALEDEADEFCAAFNDGDSFKGRAW